MQSVFLLEAHDTFRQSLAFILDREPDLEVGAQASSLAEVRGCTSLDEVDVAHILLPDGEDSTDLIREVRSYAIAVVVMTSFPSSSAVRAQALEAGAHEVLGKDVSFEELVEATRRAANGGRARLPFPERRSGAP